MLGDYVDRGEHSLENVSLPLAAKLLHSKGLVLLQGNYEPVLVNRSYGFYSELSVKYTSPFELFVMLNEVLSMLPYTPSSLTGSP